MRPKAANALMYAGSLHIPQMELLCRRHRSSVSFGRPL